MNIEKDKASLLFNYSRIINNADFNTTQINFKYFVAIQLCSAFLIYRLIFNLPNKYFPDRHQT